MTSDTPVEVLLSVPPEIVEASRSAECRPSGVLALARGQKLPRGHHALGCLACQFDAMQLKQQYATSDPALPLSFLLATRWEALTREDGLRVDFSDLSSARLRARDMGDSIEIVADRLRVTGRMKFREMVLEVRRSDSPTGDVERRAFLRLARKQFGMTISREDFQNPNVRFLIRMPKIAMTLTLPLPDRVRLSRVSERLRAAARSAGETRQTVEFAQEMLGSNAGHAAQLRLEIMPSARPGLMELRFVGEFVPAADMQLLVDGRVVQLVEPFHKGAARASASDLHRVLDGNGTLEVQQLN